jgi:hypothetical protein
MSALTRGAGTMVSGTVGTTATAIVAANFGRNFLQIECTNAATNNLAYTVDGTTPAVNGNGFTLAPLGSVTYDLWIPNGAITIIGSASGTTYTILTG